VFIAIANVLFLQPQDRLATDNHIGFVFGFLMLNVAVELQTRAVDIISLMATSQVSLCVCVCVCLHVLLYACVHVVVACVCICSSYVCSLLLIGYLCYWFEPFLLQPCAEQVAQNHYVKFAIPLLHVRTCVLFNVCNACE